MNLKTKPALAGIAMLATLAMTPGTAAEVCSLFACADASASASGDLYSCPGSDVVCWSYSASGSHTVKPLSLFAGGIGHLEAVAANSEYVGRDVCIIDIGQSSCGTSVSDNMWHGPAQFGCLQATATTKPNIGDGIADAAASDCIAPRDSTGRSVGGGEYYHLELAPLGYQLTDNHKIRLSTLLR